MKVEGEGYKPEDDLVYSPRKDRLPLLAKAEQKASPKVRADMHAYRDAEIAFWKSLDDLDADMYETDKAEEKKNDAYRALEVHGAESANEYANLLWSAITAPRYQEYYERTLGEQESRETEVRLDRSKKDRRADMPVFEDWGAEFTEGYDPRDINIEAARLDDVQLGRIAIKENRDASLLRNAPRRPHEVRPLRESQRSSRVPADTRPTGSAENNHRVRSLAGEKSQGAPEAGTATSQDASRNSSPSRSPEELRRILSQNAATPPVTGTTVEGTEIERAAIQNAKIREEAAKKNARIITIDSSKMTDDNGNPINPKNAKSLRQWLKNNYDGKEVEIQDNGHIVGFRSKELNASIKRRGDAQRQVYAALNSLLKNSVYNGYEVGDVSHPWVANQDIYLAGAQIGEGIFGIRFKIDVRRDGREIYKDHKTVRIDGVEIIKEPPSPFAGVSPTGTEGGQFIPVSKIQEALSNLAGATMPDGLNVKWPQSNEPNNNVPPSSTQVKPDGTPPPPVSGSPNSASAAQGLIWSGYPVPAPASGAGRFADDAPNAGERIPMVSTQTIQQGGMSNHRHPVDVNSSPHVSIQSTTSAVDGNNVNITDSGSEVNTDIRHALQHGDDYGNDGRFFGWALQSIHSDTRH